MAKGKATILYGIHTVRHSLNQAPESILQLWLAQTKKPSAELQAILQQAEKQGIAVQRVASKTLDELTGVTHHQGIAIKRRPQQAKTEDDLQTILETDPDRRKLFLVLDNIQDPHNLGACLRTADAVGVDAVIAPKDHTVGLTPTVCKVASGAAETVPFIMVTNLARTLRQLQEAGIWIIGADGEAENELYDVDLKASVALVMGAEGKGLRQNTRKHCDELIKLPMQGVVESLNVSVATAVCLYEVLRQRKQS